MLPEKQMYPSPRLVFWETTAACNLHCSHCRRTELADKSSPEELSTGEAEGLLDELSAWGRTILVLSGGEPLLRPDIYHLMNCASKKGLVVALATNGTLIDQQVAKLIRCNGVDRVSVSLDGADAPTHDAFRRLPGSFQSALAGTKALRAEGVPLQINVTVARHNAHQLDEMVNLTKALGAVALHLFLLVPVGCGMEIAAEQGLQADAYESTLNWLYDAEGRHSDLQLRATCAPHYFRVVRQRQAAQARMDASPSPTAPPIQVEQGSGGRGALHAATRGCLAGSGVCFVSHLGKVYGCGYMPIEAGDLRQTSLAEIWQSSTLFSQLRELNRIKGKCGRCGYQAVCGGCRARAYGSAGDFLAEEPFCAYQPGGRSDDPAMGTQRVGGEQI